MVRVLQKQLEVENRELRDQAVDLEARVGRLQRSQKRPKPDKFVEQFN
jgi:hypothetical protein